MAACTRSAISSGRTRSSVPCTMSVGARTAASHVASGVALAPSSTEAMRTSGVVSSAQPTASSRCFVECGSG